MKVMYLIDSLKAYGAEKSLVQIALSLKSIKPIFVHIYEGDDLKSVLEDNEIKTFSLNLKSSENSLNDAHTKLIPIVKEENPDIVHSTLFRADMVARRLKKKYPDIILIGSLVNNSYSKRRYSNLSLISKFKLWTTQIRDRFSIGQVDYFISNSEAIIEPNLKALGMSKEKVEVIHRGRDIENKNLISLDREFKEITKRKKVFLTVGRLSRRKGHLDLIKAFKMFSSNREDVVLLIAGEGDLRNEMKLLINELGIKKIVFLLDYREDVGSLLKLSDYFVFPSYFEGLPGALIEAILAKKPCIVSDIAENRECLPPEGALFFQVGNIQELNFSLQKALDMDNSKWQEKTSKSYNFAREKFDIKKVAEKYEEFYLKILNS